MKILICDRLDESAIREMKAAGLDVTVKTGLEAKELAREIPPYHAIVVRGATKATRQVIEAAENLKLIVRAGVGLDNIDVEAAEAKGVVVKNVPSAATTSVTEHTIGLMIALARHTFLACRSIKEGRWERGLFEGTELGGKTLGIIGFGRIGREVARLAKAFNMRVLAYDPVVFPLPSGERVGVRGVGAALNGRPQEIESTALEDLLHRSDYVTLHVPLTSETRNLLDERNIRMIKKGALLINCARGGIVDEDALADAIKEGRIAGAAIDVYEKEPPGQDNPLINLDQVLCVPHIGSSTKEVRTQTSMEAAQTVVEFLKGQISG